MDHNEFDFMDDLVLPFKEFISRLEDSHKPHRNIESVEEEKKVEESSEA